MSEQRSLTLIHGEKRDAADCAKCKNGSPSNSIQDFFGICGCECHNVAVVPRPFTWETFFRAILYAYNVKCARLAWTDQRGCVDPVCDCRAAS